MNYEKVALIQGGMGSEREVSLNTGKSFEAALKKLGANYVVIDAKEDLPIQLFNEKPDVALLALHGKYAEDGIVQGLCEYLKIPYTGSGVFASALCMNKLFSKQIFLQNNIPTPLHQVIRKTQVDLAISQLKISLPLVIKPSRDGSSVGVHICREESDLPKAFEDAFMYDSEVLVEEFIGGMELTVPMLDGKAMTPIEIAPKTAFYNYENKYTAGNTDYILPPRVKPETIEKLKSISEEVYKIFDIRAYCRVDFMADEKENVFCLEINTLPGCTETSLVPKSAKHDGIEFHELIEQLLESATRDYAGVK